METQEEKPLIAVIGGTGQQGGSVVDSYLATHRVRVLTRDPTSPKAKALAERGVEIVAGDLSKARPLISFFQGANTAFIVTQFWERFASSGGDAELASLLEFRDGKNAVDAAFASEVTTIIMSTLDNVQERTGCKYSVPHFDMKAALQSYATDRSFSTATNIAFVHVGCYYENLLGGMMPRLQEDGSYVIAFNCAERVAWVSVSDLGAMVKLLDGNENTDTQEGLVGEFLTGTEIAEKLSKHTGKIVHFMEISDDQMAQCGAPAAQEFSDMFRFYREFHSTRPQFDDHFPELHKTTLDEFLEKNSAVLREKFSH